MPVFPHKQNSAEPDAIQKAIPEVSKMQGDDALQFAVKAISGLTESILPSLPAVVAETGAKPVL